MVRQATFTGAIDKLDPKRTNDSRWLDEFPKHTDYGDFLKTGQQTLRHMMKNLNMEQFGEVQNQINIKSKEVREY